MRCSLPRSLILWLFLIPLSNALLRAEGPSHFLGEEVYTPELLIAVERAEEMGGASEFGGQKDDIFLAVDITLVGLQAEPLPLDPQNLFVLLAPGGLSYSPTTHKKIPTWGEFTLYSRAQTNGKLVFKLARSPLAELILKFQLPPPAVAVKIVLDPTVVELSRRALASADDLEANLELGKRYFNANRFKEAISPLENYLKRDSAHPLARRWLYTAKKRCGLLQNESFSVESLDLSRGYDGATLLEIAGSLFDEEKYSEAVRLYRRVLESEPHNLKAVEGLALGSYYAEDYPESLTQYHLLMGLPGGKTSESLFQRGNCHLKLKNNASAIEDWREAMRLNGANIMAAYNLGVVLHEMGRSEESLKMWRKIIESPAASEYKEQAEKMIHLIERK